MSKQQAKIDEVARRSRAMDEQFRGPEMVNYARAAEQVQNVQDFGDNKAGATTDWATSALSAGRYLPTDPRDEKMKVREALANQQSIRNMGKISDDIVEWATKKKEGEEYMRFLKFAEFLQDPKNPRTQEDMYAIVPELRDGPDKLHRENLVLQEQLRDLHQHGRIRGREDLQLLIRVCRRDFIIPTWPLWDPNGVLLGHFAEFKDLLNNHNKTRGYFNPRQWAGGLQTKATQPAGGGQVVPVPPNEALQQKIKILLLVRLLPGIRNGTDPFKTAATLLDDISHRTGAQTDNSAANAAFAHFASTQNNNNVNLIAPPFP